MRAITATGVAMAGGVLFGAVDSVVNNMSSPYVSVGAALDGAIFAGIFDAASMILDAGWAWAAIAVLAGFVVARSWRTGVVVGVSCLTAATLAYYLSESAFQQVPMAVGELAYFAVQSM